MDKKKLRSFSIESRLLITNTILNNHNTNIININNINNINDINVTVTNIFLKYIFNKYALVNNIIYDDKMFDFNALSDFNDVYPMLDSLYNKYINEEFNDIESLSWIYQYFNVVLKDEAFDMLKNNEKISSDKVSFATQVFTPKWVTEYLVNSSLGNMLGLKDLKFKVNNIELNCNIKDIKIIDPCMGTGLMLLHAFDVLLEKYVLDGFSLKDASKLILENNLYGLDIDEGAYKVACFSLLMKGYKYGLTSANLNIFLVKDNILGSLLKESSDKSVNKVLNTKYDVVITNPPYMGKKSLNKSLSNYIDENYELGKSELYSAFIVRCLELCKDNGYVSMITIHSWMFIKSFSNLRNHIIDNYYIESMVHSGAGTFDDLNSFNALATAFVINKHKRDDLTTYVRLASIYDPYKKEKGFYDLSNYYYVNNKILKEIPNSPLVYFITDKEYNLFVNCKKLKEVFPIKQGLATGDNKKFVRYWYEVDKEKINFNARSIEEAVNSGFKWFPYNKGGNFCKWYGSNEYIVNWENNGQEIKSIRQGDRLKSRPQNTSYYFKKGITWSLFGFENFGVRYKDYGFIFDVSGSSMFPDEKYLYYTLAFLSSNVCFKLLSLIAPTVNFQVGNIGELPIIFNDDYLDEINCLSKENIEICKEVWDNQETSWNYKESPLLKYRLDTRFDNSYKSYEERQNYLYNRLKANEERINEIFIKIYALEEVVNKEVIDRDLTVKKLNKEKVIKDFISYLIGCIFGRFTLDIKYETRNIIKYSELKEKIVYLLNKLFTDKYIEQIIPFDLDKYINKEFINDHMKMYQKAPIYLKIEYKKEKYLMYIHKTNDALKDLGLKPIKGFDLDDGVIVNIDKIIKHIK